MLAIDDLLGLTIAVAPDMGEKKKKNASGERSGKTLAKSALSKKS